MNNDKLLELAQKAFLNSKYNVYRFPGESIVEILSVDMDKKIVECKLRQDKQDKYSVTEFEIKELNSDKVQLVYGSGSGCGFSGSFSKSLLD